MVTCPNCGHEWHEVHPHHTDRGYVSVRLHRRKKLALFVRREDVDDAIQAHVDSLNYENEILKRKLSEATKPPRDQPAENKSNRATHAEIGGSTP